MIFAQHLLRLAMCILIAVRLPAKVLGARPPPVHIRKCCRNGELLDRASQCVAGSTEKWAPLVYMIGQDRPFERRGELPRFFKVEENVRPTRCAAPQYFSSDLAIFSNGSLFLFQKKLHLPPEDYCADKNAVLVCLASSPPPIDDTHGMDALRAPTRTSQVRKCCGPHAAYAEERRECEFFTSVADHPLHDADVVSSPLVEVIFGFPECSGHFAIAGEFRTDYLDAANGSLTLASGQHLDAHQFCLEHTTNGTAAAGGSVVKMFACSEHFASGEVNRTQASDAQGDIRFALYSVGLFISVVFLLATLAAGFLMPSSHHVLHWKCQMYYIFCLLVGDLLLAISQVSGHAIHHGGVCVTLATAMHFFFLSAFFWLNTMCFNIWWTFRDFRPTSLEKNQETWRLRLYCVYAWGVPLIIVTVGAILDNIPTAPGESFLRPRFGEQSCWFYGDLEIFAYFFGPIGALLCINLLLFASTARQLTCGLWKLDDVKSTTERTALGRVCVKLVVVMGITWIADIISWLVGGPQSVWYVTDLINALQGVFIFIVVGCQPQVWSALKRLWSTKTGQCTTTMTNGPQHSSSSHGLPSLGDSVTNNTSATTTSTKVPMETMC